MFRRDHQFFWNPRHQDRGRTSIVRAWPDSSLLRFREGTLSGDQQRDARQLLLFSHEWNLHQVGCGSRKTGTWTLEYLGNSVDSKIFKKKIERPGKCPSAISDCRTNVVSCWPRQGLKSFCLMCSRQEDYHRGVARELLHHVTTRGGKLRLADIAEPGPSCSTVSCAEAVRVALRLEQWILEGFTTARDTADKVVSQTPFWLQ